MRGARFSRHSSYASSQRSAGLPDRTMMASASRGVSIARGSTSMCPARTMHAPVPATIAMRTMRKRVRVRRRTRNMKLSKVAETASATCRGDFLSFDQAHVGRARSLCGLLDREFDALTFPQEFEHRAANGTAVKEMFDSPLIANETKAFVDEEPCDCAGWHTLTSSQVTPGIWGDRKSVV